MPDPQGTREWAPQMEEGGPDEQARVEQNPAARQAMPSREFSPSPEGGPDELARGGAEFSAKVEAERAAVIADAAATLAEVREILAEDSEPEPEEEVADLEE